MRFDGSLIFTNAGHFENEVIERVATKPELRFFIIDENYKKSLGFLH